MHLTPGEWIIDVYSIHYECVDKLQHGKYRQQVGLCIPY